MIDLCLCDWSYVERQFQDELKEEELKIESRDKGSDTKWGKRNSSLDSRCSKESLMGVSLADSQSNSWTER